MKKSLQGWPILPFKFIMKFHILRLVGNGEKFSRCFYGLLLRFGPLIHLAGVTELLHFLCLCVKHIILLLAIGLRRLALLFEMKSESYINIKGLN